MYTPTQIILELKDKGHSNASIARQLIGQHQGESTLETVLMHQSGEWISSEMKLYLTKSDPQAQGSAITYARRYSYMAIIGMVAENEDDDGEKSAIATDKQVAYIKQLALQAGVSNQTDYLLLLETDFGIKEANKIPRDRADEIINALKLKVDNHGN